MPVYNYSNIVSAMGLSSSRRVSPDDISKHDNSKEPNVNTIDVGHCGDAVTSGTQDNTTLLREATPELRRHLTEKQFIVPDLKLFQMVDMHARTTPREMALTCDRLVTYLMSSCTNSLNTVRIFYAWISLNIRCDISKTCTQITSGFDPETVLRTRAASPVGMNLLFYHFCRLVCIPCSLIHGVMKLGDRKASSIAKMTDFKTNDTTDVVPKANHAWVLIFIQGQWRFIDCACASGFGDEVKDEAMTFEFFFLPDPDDLINSHFPLGLTNDLKTDGQPETIELTETLQMLKEPITFEQWCRQATVTVLGMCIGLKLLSHPYQHVVVDKAEQFSFRSDDVTDLACILTDQTDGSDCLHSVLCTRTTSSEYRTVVKPPRPGSYGMSIFAKLDSLSRWPESFHRVVEYSLRVNETETEFTPFPEHFGVWGGNSRAVHFGFSRRIFKFDVLLCRTGDLYIKLPVTKFSRVKAVVSPATSGVLNVSSESKERQPVLSTLSMQTDGVVHIRARFSEVGFYALSLLSQNRDVIQDAGTAFIQVADFLVNCRLPTKSLSPLPKSFPMSQHFRCLLQEPLCRRLVAGHVYNFRLVSPCLKIVKVDGEAMRLVSNRVKQRSKTNNDDVDDDCDDNDDDDDSCDEEKGRRDDGIEDGDNDKGCAWFLSFTPKDAGSPVYVYGCGSHVDNKGMERRSTTLSALFMFDVIASDKCFVRV